MILLYGTGNPAKLEHMRFMLQGMDIQLLGLGDMKTPLPEIPETGRNPLENALLKANAYYRAFRQPVFSCDSGLYIEGIPEEQQPGVHVRKVNDRRLNDDEMMEHYASIAHSMGGSCVAQYRNAICLIFNETHVITHIGEELDGDRFLIVSRPHPERRAGFPLDSLSVEIASGKYYYDLREERFLYSMSDGFREFFSRALQLREAQ